MDTTRLENAARSYGSVPTVSGFSVVRHGAIFGVFGPKVTGETTAIPVIMDSSTAAGGAGPVIFPTRSRSRRHNRTNYHRGAPQGLPCRSVDSLPVGSREDARFNLPDRSEPQRARIASRDLSSNPTVRMRSIEFIGVARLGKGAEAESNPRANAQEFRWLSC